MSEAEKTKQPWVWKAAIMALPLGLIAGIVIAMTLKVSKGPRNDMVAAVYAAGDFSEAGLLDSVSKLEGFLGERSFSGELGQQQMRGTAALIQGTLGPNNLGYSIESEPAVTREGKVWRHFWIESESVSGKGDLLIWADYTDPSQSASVAALLSLAEWVRGRNFGRQITIAFVADPTQINEIVEDGDLIRVRVGAVGHGTRGLTSIEGDPQDLVWNGESGEASAADWKLTTSWEDYLSQVNQITAKVSEIAGETVLR